MFGRGVNVLVGQNPIVKSTVFKLHQTIKHNVLQYPMYLSSIGQIRMPLTNSGVELLHFYCTKHTVTFSTNGPKTPDNGWLQLLIVLFVIISFQSYKSVSVLFSFSLSSALLPALDQFSKYSLWLDLVYGTQWEHSGEAVTYAKWRLDEQGTAECTWIQLIPGPNRAQYLDTPCNRRDVGVVCEYEEK